MRAESPASPQNDPDCLLALFDEAVAQARAGMLSAFRSADSWVDGTRAALYELLAFLDRDPDRARLLLVNSLDGDPPLRRRRASVLRELAAGLEAGRPTENGEALQAPFGPDAVIAAAAAILHGRLLEDPVPRLAPLGGPLMAAIVLPFLGVGAARGELGRLSGGALSDAEPGSPQRSARGCAPHP